MLAGDESSVRAGLVALTILIFIRASLQSSSRYRALRLYILTTPRSNWPVNLSAMGAWLGVIICSTLSVRFDCKMCCLDSLRSRLADSQTRAKGPVFWRRV